MRLTSYNIALVRLKAGCCLSEIVERMWEYMEEGDVEKADCARGKALMLHGLIQALCRWRPTITEGYLTEFDADYSTVTYPDPFIHGSSIFNGVNVLSPFIAYGDSDDIVEAHDAASCSFISPDDDIIQVSFRRTAEDNLSVTVLSKDELTQISGSGSDATSGSVDITYSTDNEEFSSVQPPCLTDAQVLSVIGKIDELCECNC